VNRGLLTQIRHNADIGQSSSVPSVAGVKSWREVDDLRLTSTATLALGVATACWFVFSYGYIEDDAFIHLVFARSLAEGRGFAFNGLVTNGDTAPIWPMLLAGIHALGVSWIGAAKLACALGFMAAVSGIWVLARDLAAGRSEQRWLPVASVLVTVVNPFFVHWSFSGMEAVTALAVSLWTIRLVFIGNPAIARCIVAAVLLALGPLLRPELLLLAAVAGPALLFRRWQSYGQLPLSRRLVEAVALSILMALPVLLWAGYALGTFGAIVPNTNLAKRAGADAGLALRLASVYALGFPVTLLLLPVVTLPRLGRGQFPAAITVLLLWPLACVAFYLANHTDVQTRYCLLSMPSMSIAVLWLLGAANRPRIFAGAVVAMVSGAAVVIAAIVVPHVANKERYGQALSQVAACLREQIPPQSKVAIFAIGQVAFESRHPLVDVGGITDRSVIPYLGDFDATLHWAKRQGARYYVTGGPPEPGAVPVFTMSVPFLGWTFRHSSYSSQQLLGIYRLQ
jgi:hypothetical protein